MRGTVRQLAASCAAACSGRISGRAGSNWPTRAPDYADDYAAAFGCEVRFGRGCNRVLIDRAWLATPMPAHNAVSAQQVLALCDAQMPAGQASSEIVAVVERLLRQRLAENPRAGRDRRASCT